MRVLRVLLFPFAVLYRVAAGVRNHLYDIGHKRSFRFEIPVIGVGNLSMGGSGKTPTIEYLVRLLQSRYKIATLSRGYGRRTRGLRFAGEQDNATTLGDEPFQFYRNFKDEVNVVVGEDRAFAIPNIINKYPDTSVVLLDDAFQHRSVNPHLQILLTDYNTPFFKDFVLPSGRLRESRKGASRADIIVVTKCRYDISKSECELYKKSIRRYSGQKPIFFSFIMYGRPKSIWKEVQPIGKRVVILSGIAKPKQFEEYVNSKFEVVRHFSFADHYDYKESEVKQIGEVIEKGEGLSLLTTEKDMVRLLNKRFEALLSDLPCFYLPIEVDFKENGAEFDNLVLNKMENALPSEGSGNE